MTKPWLALDRANNFFYHRLEEAELPHASFGACFYAPRCGSWEVDLGNGLCGTCWDNGLEGAMKRSMESKTKQERNRNGQEQKARPLSSYQSSRYTKRPLSTP